MKFTLRLFLFKVTSYSFYKSKLLQLCYMQNTEILTLASLRNNWFCPSKAITNVFPEFHCKLPMKNLRQFQPYMALVDEILIIFTDLMSWHQNFQHLEIFRKLQKELECLLTKQVLTKADVMHSMSAYKINSGSWISLLVY